MPGGIGPVGAVIGPTHMKPPLDLPGAQGLFLAPGTGPQGATAADVAEVFASCPDRVIPSASRSLLGEGPDPSRLREAAAVLVGEFRAALADEFPVRTRGVFGHAPAAKLGIKEGSKVAIVGASGDVDLDLPPGVAVSYGARGTADVVLAFVTRQAELEQRLDRLGSMVFPSGGLWIAWPKKSAGLVTDLSDQTIRETVLSTGLVDNKVCAVDGTWSALRFVWRVERRPP